LVLSERLTSDLTHDFLREVCRCFFIVRRIRNGILCKELFGLFIIPVIYDFTASLLWNFMYFYDRAAATVFLSNVKTFFRLKHNFSVFPALSGNNIYKLQIVLGTVLGPALSGICMPNLCTIYVASPRNTLLS
jgi:hypothetical protein